MASFAQRVESSREEVVRIETAPFCFHADEERKGFLTACGMCALELARIFVLLLLWAFFFFFFMKKCLGKPNPTLVRKAATIGMREILNTNSVDFAST